MKRLTILAVVMLCSGQAMALTIQEPTDYNTMIGTWLISPTDDVNQPLWAAGDGYEGKTIPITIQGAAGLPGGLALVQMIADMNLPASAYPCQNDPCFIALKNPKVGRAYVRGRLTSPAPIGGASVQITSYNKTKTLIIKPAQETPHIITQGTGPK
jgi:hypothetical protein